MKGLIVAFASLFILQACNNHGTDQGGAVNDGIKAVDSNGGLADTAFKGNQSATDTAKMEDRTDISTRDTARHK